jgi:IS4 transposase
VGFDLREQRITEVEVTGVREGETLVRHQVRGGEIMVVDRGYAHREGIEWVLSRGGHLVVRVGWNRPVLHTVGRRRLALVPLLGTLAANEVGDWQVVLQGGKRNYRMRLVALKKSAAATENARRRLRRQASKKCHAVDPRSLKAAAYVFVLTDLPAEELPAVEVLELYRVRWQVEIVFKRLKSLLKLHKLRAKDPQLVRTYMLANILGALVVEEMWGQALSFFPWGFRLPPAAVEPLASVCSVG